VLTVNAQVYVASTNTISGSTVMVPIRLEALGTESGLQFSLAYDSTGLMFLGVDDPSVLVTTNLLNPGTVGFNFHKGAGYPAGDQLLANVLFLAQATASNRVNNITFGAVPVAQVTVDNSLNLITNVTYAGGSVLVAPQTNTPPTLAPVANQTIGVGVTMIITNLATDTNVPVQTLNFSLLTAPTNAALDANGGVLTWRPLVTQANTINPFSVVVADNGTPSLSATQSFVVSVTNLVTPVVSAVAPIAGQLVLQVNGASGPDYQIQSSTDLVNWTGVFTTNSPAIPFVWTNNNTGSPMNFFRVQAGPPF
jgi:hypothetical protein